MHSNLHKELRAFAAAIALIPAAAAFAAPAVGPLQVNAGNPRHFTDGTRSATGALKAGSFEFEWLAADCGETMGRGIVESSGGGQIFKAPSTKACLLNLQAK